jgi:hypothetical protein
VGVGIVPGVWPGLLGNAWFGGFCWVGTVDEFGSVFADGWFGSPAVFWVEEFWSVWATTSPASENALTVTNITIRFISFSFYFLARTVGEESQRNNQVYTVYGFVAAAVGFMMASASPSSPKRAPECKR